MVDLFWFGMCQGCHSLEYWKKEKPVSGLLAFFPLGLFCSPLGNAPVFSLFYSPRPPSLSLFLMCRNLATFLPPHSELEPHFPVSPGISPSPSPPPQWAISFYFIANKRRLMSEPLTGPALQIVGFFLSKCPVGTVPKNLSLTQERICFKQWAL